MAILQALHGATTTTMRTSCQRCCVALAEADHNRYLRHLRNVLTQMTELQTHTKIHAVATLKTLHGAITTTMRISCQRKFAALAEAGKGKQCKTYKNVLTQMTELQTQVEIHAVATLKTLHGAITTTMRISCQRKFAALAEAGKGKQCKTYKNVLTQMTELQTQVEIHAVAIMKTLHGAMATTMKISCQRKSVALAEADKDKSDETYKNYKNVLTQITEQQTQAEIHAVAILKTRHGAMATTMKILFRATCVALAAAEVMLIHCCYKSMMTS